MFYNQNENGIDKLYCSDSLVNSFLIGLTKDNSSLLIDTMKKDTIYVKHSTLNYAPSLLKLDLQNLIKQIKYKPHHAGYLKLKDPDFVEIEREGTSFIIPSYFWKADYTDLGKKTIIYIHGGPHLQTKPLWDARTKLLTEFGFNLLAINYHGSTGYSHQYTQKTSKKDQISDVLAAIRYLMMEYDIKQEDIILMDQAMEVGLH